VKKATANWLKIAQYDLKVANDNFKAGNLVASIEKCHNALEKLLKGIITENDEEPKKIHDLLRLVSEASITNLQDDVKDTLQELNSIYVNTRYPEEFELIQERLDEKRSKEILSETKRIF
jgi:HEPN domain-containing protein